MVNAKRVIVWFRLDLRLEDNPALSQAISEQAEIIPVYVFSPHEEKPWEIGGAARWWLHHSLSSLDRGLRNHELKLIIRQGNSLPELIQLAKETKASAIYWNRRYEPKIIERDKKIKQELLQLQLDAQSFNSNLLFEPWEISNQQNKPYQVYTAFWNACIKAKPPRKPLAVPKNFNAYKTAITSLSVSDLKLLPKIAWYSEFSSSWTPGTETAKQSLKAFLKNSVNDYDELRNRPDLLNTSRLSPHLHFGEISPQMIWHTLNTLETKQGATAGLITFKKELVWREFAHHLLFHFPETDLKPLRKEFKNFPWKTNNKHLQAWEKGQTGYPIVDAGMRELWTTGWMHNRVRMIVASFLVKHLLIPWQDGAKWFWDTLVDADLASNTLGWQWTAGSGADAAPYFRVFNPIIQGEKFDPQGLYTKRWVPELSKLPIKWLFKPWEAPQAILTQANVRLGSTYPKPIVDHNEARERALEAYDDMKTGAQND